MANKKVTHLEIHFTSELALILVTVGVGSELCAAPEETRDAWEKTIVFLDENLK